MRPDERQRFWRRWKKPAEDLSERLLKESWGAEWLDGAVAGTADLANLADELGLPERAVRRAIDLALLKETLAHD